MAHRTLPDVLAGRYYCPACGKAAGFKTDFAYNKTKMRWYRFAPHRLVCNACGTSVRGHISNAAWFALTIWGAFAAGATYTFELLKDQGVISGNGMQFIAFVVVVLFPGLCLLSFYTSYKVDNNAP